MTAGAIRPPTAEDLARLATIEDLADRLLIDLLQPSVWEAAVSGGVRAAMPGFLLVAAEEQGGVAVGFAHVLEVDGFTHLDQVSVLPAHGRRGHGHALVEAAKAEAAGRGHDRITLRTFAAVRWNAPFYATCGFVRSPPDSPFHRALERSESAAGIDRWGERVQMTAPLAP